jgi:predicted histidine transporter YuiF (NhaC family)
LDDLFKTIEEKIDEIKDQGYDVKQMWGKIMVISNGFLTHLHFEGLVTQLVTATEGTVDEIAADLMLLTVNGVCVSLFEVEMSKKTIRLDLPMQIVCFGFQVQKPHI